MCDTAAQGDKLDCLFALLSSARVKAACKHVGEIDHRLLERESILHQIICHVMLLTPCDMNKKQISIK